MIPIDEYLGQMKLLVTGNTQLVLLDIFFEDEEEDDVQRNERKIKINETLLRLFYLKPKQLNEKYNENNYLVFRKLQLLPKAQKAIAQRLCDREFLLGSFPEWSQRLSKPDQFKNMVQMISTFDRETQMLFYKNLGEAMHRSDQLQPYTYFHVSKNQV